MPIIQILTAVRRGISGSEYDQRDKRKSAEYDQDKAMVVSTMGPVNKKKDMNHE